MSEEGAAKGSSGGNKGMMMIIMAMLGLIILALAGVAVFLFMTMNNLGGGEEGTTGNLGDTHVAVGVAPPISEQVMFDLSESISTNMGDRHFVRLDNISLGINNTEPEAALAFVRELATRERAIMDAIHRILRNTAVEDLSLPEGADLLRADILDALQVAFDSPMIVAIYLTVYTVPI
jgi:flagellar basal body-associated protein FliL